MVKHEYDGSWPAALRAFVEDPLNKWCPPWIRNNYQILNEEASDDEDEQKPDKKTTTGTEDDGNPAQPEKIPHENNKNIQ